MATLTFKTTEESFYENKIFRIKMDNFICILIIAFNFINGFEQNYLKVQINCANIFVECAKTCAMKTELVTLIIRIQYDLKNLIKMVVDWILI